jgi:hypothetical protein
MLVVVFNTADIAFFLKVIYFLFLDFFDVLMLI